VTQLPAPNDDWTSLGDVPARVANNEIRALINARLTKSPLDPAVQQQLSDLLASSERAVQRACEQCALHWTGAIRYSEATRKAAERDIKLLSTMASLGILLLFTLTFRAIRPLLVTAGTILSAILAGLATSFAVFGTVHVLTLVFGTTLLGLCVDYLLHFMVHRWAHADDSGAAALRAVAPGLLLGLASSVTAFLFLLFAGFPALSQLAVFSIAGLLTAWLLVHLCLPELLTPGTANNVVARLAITRVALSTKARLVLLAAIGMIALTGIPQLRIVDDVRGLQAVPDALSDDNHFVRTTLEGMPGDTGNADFVLVEAPDLDTALEREMQLLNSMEGPDGFGLSRFLLPQGAREANLRAYAALFENDGRQLRLILSAFGFRPALADDLVARYTTSTADVTPSATLLAQPAFDAQRTLLVTVENGVALMTRIPGDVRIPEQMPWARFIRPLEKIESTFSSIRQRGTIAVAAAWLLMLSILSFRYGPVGGVRVLAPALFGACVAVGFLGLAGWPLNIFSLVALILVLGIGADYALFLREGAAHIGTARLATTLAAATSLLSFGLLAFSSLPALRAFGFAISIGILTAFLAAPLALPLMAERKRASQRMDELDEAA
ncbi:MAG: hypothetical protein KY410_08695, partial [Proteobacteria bacterium]|nr:hypothetical protein [Pseudomonadota bacterium]